MSKDKDVKVNPQFVIDALRLKLSQQDLDSALLTAVNRDLELKIVELEKKLKEVTEAKLEDIQKQMESIKKGVVKSGSNKQSSSVK